MKTTTGRSRMNQALRAMQGLILALTLLPGAVGPALPALADPVVNDHRDPSARLEVVVKRVHIFDDQDWGEGEIKLDLDLLKLRECPPAERGALDFCRDRLGKSTISF